MLYDVYMCTEINQPIKPAELPIIGDPYTEISLDLLFPTRNSTFTLIGKHIQLTQPLDRDAENLSHIVFQVTIFQIYINSFFNIFLCTYVLTILNIVFCCNSSFLNSFLFLLLGYVRGKVYQQKEDHTHNSPHDRH